MARQVLLTLALACLAAGADAAEVSRARYVMGTLLRLSVKGESPATDAAADKFFAEAERWDRLLSTYKPESEVSRINREAPAAVAVSTDTAWAVCRALEWAEKTGGAFDPTVGPLVRLWGIGRPDARVPDRGEVEKLLPLVGAAEVECATAAVRLGNAGMALDFGAIGKGLALDRALAAAAGEPGVAEIAADFGGQLLFWSAVPAEWSAAVRHPGRAGESVEPVRLRRNGSLSTSSASEKFILAADPKDAAGGLPKRYGHILDPRTGFPAEGAESVTVWAPEAEAADVYSTALFVMGAEKGLEYADARGVAALFVVQGEKGLSAAASKAWKAEFGGTR